MLNLRAFHRVAGIVVAIPLALTALSGGLLLLRDPHYRSRFPALAQPVTAPQLAVRGDVLTGAETMFLPASPRVVKFPRDRFNAYHLFLTDGSEALVDAEGTLLDRWRWNERLMPALFELHAHLLAGQTGKTINGVAAIGALLLAVSGLADWWPRRRALPPGRVRPAALARGEMLRSHAATGAVIAVPVLLFAATGAGIVFYEPASRLAGALDSHPALEPTAVVDARAVPRRPWGELIAAADAAFGGTSPAMVYPGTARNAAVTFRARLDGEWHPNGRSYALVDPYSGVVVQAIDARTQGRGTRAMHALYPLHAARTGGLAMMAIAALSAAGLTWLVIGGVWLYGARRRRQADLRLRGGRTDLQVRRGAVEVRRVRSRDGMQDGGPAEGRPALRDA